MSLWRLFTRGRGPWSHPRRHDGGAEPFTWNVPTYRQNAGALDFELRRCRRYEHPLTLLLVGADAPAARNGAGRAGADPMLAHTTPASVSPSEVFFLLGSLLRDALRETDLVSYVAEDHLYAVVLPETDEAEAGRAMLRLARVFAERAHLPLRWSTAAFPRDGFSIPDLLDAARAAWERPPAQPPVREVREASRG